jgi:hypothetical protein
LEEGTAVEILGLPGAPEAPDGAWYKDFGSFKICGEGECPKSFLLRGQPAGGRKL